MKANEVGKKVNETKMSETWFVSETQLAWIFRQSDTRVNGVRVGNFGLFITLDKTIQTELPLDIEA